VSAPGGVPAEVIEAVRAHQAAGDRVVFTNGCFDLLHPGHVCSLRAARELGDVLVVGLNGDASVRALKGPDRPVLPAAARSIVLAEMRCVDHVVVFEDETPIELLRALRPDIYVKGSDWRHRPLAEADLVREQGGQVVFVERVTSYSTSALIESIRALPLSDGKAPDAR